MTSASTVSATPQIRRLRAREARENYPVAPWWVPAWPRRHLHAVYAAGRLIDDTGDLEAGDRTAQLMVLREDLARVWDGANPDSPVLQALVPTVTACGLAQAPFQQLIEASLIDQQVHEYATFEDLLRQCQLSATPMGRLVLQVFGQASQAALAQSDQVCSALQILEHCQDVAEDHSAGRIYLPQRDLDEFGVHARDLAADAPDTAQRRSVVARQVDRCEALLDDGATIIGNLAGWGARTAVAGYVAGGHATIAALRAADFDVWHAPITPRRIDILCSMARQLSRARTVPR